MPEIPFFYTNSLQVSLTPYDVLLEFLRQGSSGDPTKAIPVGPDGHAAGEVRDRLSVAMSPMHCKAMIASMVLVVQQFEAQFGPIPVLPEVQKAYDEFVKPSLLKAKK
jgi:hypothetical protein